jgi:uncharacterized protein YbjQ (UPF0145 family)
VGYYVSRVIAAAAVVTVAAVPVGAGGGPLNEGTDFAYLDPTLMLEPIGEEAAVEVIAGQIDRPYKPVAFLNAYKRRFLAVSVSTSDIIEKLKSSARQAGCPAIINVVIKDPEGNEVKPPGKASSLQARATGIVWIDEEATAGAPEPEAGEVAVFAETPTRPFEAVAELKVNETAFTPLERVRSVQILEKLRARAREEACDAIIEVEIEDYVTLRPTVFSVWGGDRVEEVHAKRGRATGIVWLEGPGASLEPPPPESGTAGE